MPLVADVIAFLEQLAPVSLAEEWDNVGLLVGNRQREVSAAMTCLTLTEDVAAEAVAENVQLIVSHHPVLFRPIQKLTADNAEGRTLLTLIEAGIAVYSPHTGYDSAKLGINQQLAELLVLRDIGVLRPAISERQDAESPSATVPDAGGGRYGTLAAPVELSEFTKLVATRLGAAGIQYVGHADTRVQRVAVACGSAAEFLRDAKALGCDVLVTGEARFHDCLEARSTGTALVLVGHYATERPGIERLATLLADEFPSMRVTASQHESDPIRWT